VAKPGPSCGLAEHRRGAPVADDIGVPLLIVSRQRGHASPQITATIYAHRASDDQLDAGAQAFRVDADSGGKRRSAGSPSTKPPCALRTCRLVRSRSGVRLPSSASRKAPRERGFLLLLDALLIGQHRSVQVRNGAGTVSGRAGGHRGLPARAARMRPGDSAQANLRVLAGTPGSGNATGVLNAELPLLGGAKMPRGTPSRTARELGVTSARGSVSGDAG